jgi:hypothetical protein
MGPAAAADCTKGGDGIAAGGAGGSGMLTTSWGAMEKPRLKGPISAIRTNPTSARSTRTTVPPPATAYNDPSGAKSMPVMS